MVRRVGIHQRGRVSLEDLIGDVRACSELSEAGAIGCFVGIVRGVARDGGKVRWLGIEAHKKRAIESLSKIASDIIGRGGVVDVRIHHNVGKLEVGNDIVYIVVAGGHREDVFQALKDAIDRLKKEAPIWKKEYSDSGEYWVSESVGVSGSNCGG